MTINQRKMKLAKKINLKEENNRSNNSRKISVVRKGKNQ